jgi:hypothetical protein
MSISLFETEWVKQNDFYAEKSWKNILHEFILKKIEARKLVDSNIIIEGRMNEKWK